jgi:thiaminase
MGAIAVGDEDGIARRLWIKFRNESVLAIYTPFVVCLASGKLDTDSFLHCITQDVHFLQAFAQAYDLAEDCADDDDDKVVIRKLRRRVLKKLKMYNSIVQEWGFEVPTESTYNKSTTNYTSFLMAAASGKAVGDKFPGKIATPFEKTKLAAYALAAIAPCMRFRAFLCTEIQNLLDPDETNHIYKKWIDSLSSKKYEVSASQIEDLLDKLTISLTGEELEVVENLYHQAVKLELDFFSSQPIAQHAVVPLSQCDYSDNRNVTIVCDFDMTCSAIDSSALLAEIAIIKASNLSFDECDVRNIWSALSRQYIEEHEECIEDIMLGGTVGEFDYKSVCKVLEQLSSFEKRANSRVVQSGVLKGLSLEDIQWAGEHLVLQDGCRKFFKEIVEQEDNFGRNDVHVLSYCWCGDLIRSAFSPDILSISNVHSNELVYEEGLITTGDIERKVESPIEKLQAFDDIILENQARTGQSQLTIFIGGSVGDLLSLLKADIGIAICPSPSLKKVGDKFGISFVPLFSGLVKKQQEFGTGSSSNWKGLSGTLYTVTSWAEIHAFILGS